MMSCSKLLFSHKSLKMKRLIALLCVCIIVLTVRKILLNSFVGVAEEEYLTIVDIIAENLRVQYTLMNNSEICVQKVLLINNGCQAISGGNWTIYFYSFGLIEKSRFPYTKGILFRKAGVRIYHKSGYLYALEPDVELFKPILSGHNISLEYTSANFISTKTDVLPNWYVSAKNMTPKILASTFGESMDFLTPFDNFTRYKRFSYDRFRPVTVENRFLSNSDTFDLGYAPHSIIPTPFKIQEEKHSNLTIYNPVWVVVRCKYFTKEVNYIAEKLSLKVVDKKYILPGKSAIVFKKERLSFLPKTTSFTNTSDEAYTLNVNTSSKSVLIKSFTSTGAFYAIQSLFAAGTIHRTGQIPRLTVPQLYVEDQPRFGYRGLHIDVARNFQKKQEILKMLDVMASYKLNKLHFHLSDDEAWRMQIPGLPELTTLGANRCHDDTETECLSSQLGSGPFKTFPGSGFYTVSDYQEILKFANDCHIKIIPEFDMPGHARAAIKSMELRYFRLRDANITEAAQYLLSELGDLSIYHSVQGFTDNAINPCIESTYTFIAHLVKSMKTIHQPIQPLKTFHYGGDEVPIGSWEKSLACYTNMLISKNINKTGDFKKYFIWRVIKILDSEGLHAGAWEDGVMDTDKQQFNISELPTKRSIYTNAWQNVWEWRLSHRAYTLANDRYKVILSHATHLYFDHPHEPDREERGLSWANRNISTKDVFSYRPFNLYGNIGFTLAGTQVWPWMLTNCSLKIPSNIVGMQAQIWSETVRSASHLEFMVFPRLLAFAERAWHRADWEMTTDKYLMMYEWTKFANTIGYRELQKLDARGIEYRVPPPGAKVQNSILHVNTEIPGLEVEYSTDNGVSWTTIRNVDVVSEDENIFLRTKSADRKRYSRIVTWYSRKKLSTTSSQHPESHRALYPS